MTAERLADGTPGDGGPVARLDHIVIELWPQGEILNMNDRRPRMSQAALTKAWRDAAYWAACAAFPGVGPSGRRLPWTKSRVVVSLPCQVRDPHNAYPTVKALLDGLTDAGLWPDDDSKHVVTSEPVIVRATRKTKVLIAIREEPA